MLTLSPLDDQVATFIQELYKQVNVPQHYQIIMITMLYTTVIYPSLYQIFLS